MKRTFVLSLVAAAALSLNGCKQSAETQSEGMTDTANSGEAIAMTTANFGVRGNCGMCKTTIETAASEVDGVDSATWDREMKSMEVSLPVNMMSCLGRICVSTSRSSRTFMPEIFSNSGIWLVMKASVPGFWKTIP